MLRETELERMKAGLSGFHESTTNEASDEPAAGGVRIGVGGKSAEVVARSDELQIPDRDGR